MDIISRFQELVAQVPEIIQPLIVALAGAVPFIEGEGAASIGILGGVHPVIAVIAATLGNFLCVTVLVLTSSRARSAIVSRRAKSREVVVAGGGGHSDDPLHALEDKWAESDHKSARRAKFQRALDRYGVPGVSMLGPLLLPTQFTATMLAAGGVAKARVLIWQAIAILAWTIVFGVVIGSVVHSVR
ncbi:small multidrug efflux protein [Salinibacterium sp.]|uniref:small multidrug efflux protein n=1 Tax=Salinibacterium sp. TaxID=1915057 RepID=UPI00286D3794|nr:small multidrug efflux protein [Salinibacterium sp.]